MNNLAQVIYTIEQGEGNPVLLEKLSIDEKHMLESLSALLSQTSDSLSRLLLELPEASDWLDGSPAFLPQ